MFNRFSRLYQLALGNMLNPQLTQHIVNFDTTDAAGDAVSKSSTAAVAVPTVENNHKHDGSANDASAGIDKPGYPLLDFRADLLSLLIFLVVVNIFFVSERHSIMLSIGFGLFVGATLQPNLRLCQGHVRSYRRRRLKVRKELGEEVAALLGSIGAPLIHPALDSSESSLSVEQLKFLSRFVRSQVELIGQLNESIDLVRRGTSLMFGVAPAHVLIERVERAALLRGSRHSNDFDASSCRMPVSLPTLRKRIHEILERQIEGLLKLSGQACVAERQSKTNVITLSLLSYKKSYAVNLLANVVGLSSRSRDDNMYRAMDRCTHEAGTSRKYISAATTHIDLISTPDKSSGLALSLLNKLEPLRVALLNNLDNECNDHQLELGDLPARWATVEKLAQKFEEALEQTTLQLKEGTCSGVLQCDSDDSSNTALQHDDRCPVEVSHASHTDQGSTVHLHVKFEDESETLNKTLVFSGVSGKRKARTRNRTKPCLFVSSGSLPSQSELVDELNERLRSLPPVDELSVRNGAVDDGNDDECKISATCTFDKVRISRFAAANAIDTAPANLSSSFLGELQDSMAATFAGVIVGQACYEDNDLEQELEM